MIAPELKTHLFIASTTDEMFFISNDGSSFSVQIMGLLPGVKTFPILGLKVTKVVRAYVSNSYIDPRVAVHVEADEKRYILYLDK